jgi:predicted RND superfamily exporter protein
LYKACTRKAWLTLSGVGLLFLISLFLLPQQKHLISYRDLFDLKFLSAKRYDEVIEKFSLANRVFLIVRPRDGVWNSKRVCQFKNWISEQQTQNDEIESVNSVFSLRKTENTPYSIHYPWIFNPRCDGSDDPSIPDFQKLESSIWNGTLYSSRSHDLGVEFNFRDTPGGSRYGKFDPKPVSDLVDHFDQDLGREWVAVWTGPAIYDYTIRKNVGRTRVLNLVVLAILLLFYRAYLGTWISGIIMASTLLITGVILFGLMTFFGAPMDLLASGLFLMVTIAAHQDFSYLSSAARKTKNLLFLFRRFLVPSFFTSFTTIVGFASLGLSKIPMIARFGIWAAVGAFLEWFMVLIVLPSVLRRIRVLPNWVDESRAWIQNPLQSRFWRFIKPSRKMSFALLSLVALMPFAIEHANFSDDPKDLFESSHPFRKAIAYILQSRDWSQDIQVVFSADVSEKRRIELEKKFMQDPLVVARESSATIEQYFTQGLGPLDEALVKRDLDASEILKHFQAKTGEFRAIYYLKDSEQKDILQFKQKVESQCPEQECYVTGPIELYHEFVSQVSVTLTESLLMSLALVTLILYYLVWARRVPFGWQLIVSSLWGPCFILVLISALQISINAFTSSIAAIMVGLAGDNAIQFMFAYRKSDFEGRMQTRGEGAVFTSLVMAACSLSFLAAVYRPPKMLGSLLCLGFLACFYGDYGILSGLISRQPKKL